MGKKLKQSDFRKKFDFKKGNRLPASPKQFWVTNTNFTKDVSIDDLRVTIKRGRSVNLLDRRHYSFTEEQIKNSYEKGSLKRKSNDLKVMAFAPMPKPSRIDIDKKPRQLKKLRHAVDVEEKLFDELDYEDDSPENELEFASENADAEFHDRAPILAVDKKFINGGEGDA